MTTPFELEDWISNNINTTLTKFNPTIKPTTTQYKLLRAAYIAGMFTSFAIMAGEDTPKDLVQLLPEVLDKMMDETKVFREVKFIEETQQS